MVKKRAFSVLAIILLGIIIAPSTVAVFAEESRPPLHAGISNNKTGTTNSSYDQFEIEPGQTYTKSFSFYNLGTKDFNVSLSVTPYSVIDEEYSANQTTETAHTNISRWITFPKNNFVMKADSGGFEEIEYIINVPDDIPAGAQRARIVVAARLSDKDSSDMVKQVSLGYTILTAVSGGKTNIDTRLTHQDIPFFYFTGPIGDIVRVENKGNVDSFINHRVTFSNFFNNELAYDSGASDYYVLTDTTRLITARWDGAPLLGIFKVKSTVIIDKEIFELEKISVVIPLFLIIIVILFVLLVFALLIMRHKKRRQAKSVSKKPSWEQG